MIRRILLVAVAAVAVVLVPSVAMAYNAPGYSSTVSDSTPAVGQSVTITVNASPNEAIRLVITSPDGVKTLRGTANASGVATFTFKAGSGKTTVQAFNAADQLLSDQILNAHATGGDSGDDGDDGDNNGSELSDTGFNGMGLAAGAGALVLVGAGAVVVAKRRRSAHVAA